jgi:hypothetical protein
MPIVETTVRTALATRRLEQLVAAWISANDGATPSDALITAMAGQACDDVWRSELQAGGWKATATAALVAAWS